MGWLMLAMALLAGCAQGTAVESLSERARREAGVTMGVDADKAPTPEAGRDATVVSIPDGGAPGGRSVTLEVPKGRIRVTAYGEHIVRLQWTAGEFEDDARYDIVERHDWPGSLERTDEGANIVLRSGGVRVSVDASGAVACSGLTGSARLTTLGPPARANGTLALGFVPDPGEHFGGLGHGYYGRVPALDLSGTTQQRRYGSAHVDQAPLLVPFYMSSRGYGLLVNSTFDARFSFRAPDYGLALDEGAGQLDVFYIDGEDGEQRLVRVLDHYTELTGRPRLPPRAMFGLALSDKGAPATSSAAWWQAKVAAHRGAGFPLDHVVNDNRWRAGGGERCVSRFDWDPERYPNPTEFASWLRREGLVSTVDFNRCIAKLSEGWRTGFNVPGTGAAEYGDSAPDLTRAEVRDWWWELVREKAFADGLADALWVDEFDEIWFVPKTQVVGDGRTWAEVKNAWFGLVARTIGTGWDRDIGEARRPFIWVRGGSAGGQRWATLWSGDVAPTFSEMALQIRGMQAAGLSGFPFWGHDAGGFGAEALSDAAFDPLYQSWSMAMGAFTPYWKPHGVGPSRWPLDRNALSQLFAKRYGDLRYQLLPYLYGAAVDAARTGLPIARAMLLAHPGEPSAWRADLQYYFGDALLVVPETRAPVDGGSVAAWLPPGAWFGFWDDAPFTGGRDLAAPTVIGEMPLFVRAGSVIPMAPAALSTTTVTGDALELHVWVGADGSRVLVEDDGRSERWHTEQRTTRLTWDDATLHLSVAKAEGSFEGAVSTRRYRVVLHGLTQPLCAKVAGVAVPFAGTGSQVARWLTESKRSLLEVVTGPVGVDRALDFSFAASGCSSPTSTRYEAEAAATTGVAGQKPRASGGAFVGSLVEAGRYVRFTVRVPKDGAYRLRLGFANGRTENAVRTVRVDGVAHATPTFGTQGSWLRFVATELPPVQLTAAQSHTVEVLTVTGQPGTIDIDFLDVLPEI